MKLTEQAIVEELAKVGYGGTQAQAAAAAIVKRAKLTELEVANAVDDLLVAQGHKPYKLDERRDMLEPVVRRLAQ